MRKTKLQSYSWITEKQEPLSEQEALLLRIKKLKKNQRASENRTALAVLALLIIFILGYFATNYQISLLQKDFKEFTELAQEGNKIYEEKLKEQSNGMIKLEDFVDENIVKVNDNLAELNKSVKEQNKKIDNLEKHFKTPYTKSPVQIKKQYPQNIKIANGLVARGFSKEDAAAITGNIMVESSGNTKAIGDSGTSIGYMQWHAGRKNALQNFAKKKGKHWSDHDTQLDFIVHEYKKTAWKKHYDRAFKKKTVRDKAYTFCKEVEKPANYAFKQSIGTRIAHAEQTYKEII